VKSKDIAKAAALANTLIVPTDSTWFQDEFGPAFGPRLAAAYQKTKPEMEVEIVTVFKGNADRGWTQPKIFRYDDAATVDSPTDRFLNCMDKVVPLYKTAFDGNRTGYQMGPRTDEPGRSKIIAGDLPGYYVYTGGSFRFVSDEILFLLPKERPIRVQLDMAVMRPKVTNDSVGGVGSEKIEPLANQHIHGKVVIHFVLDTNGKIKEIEAVKGSSELREPFLEAVKPWTFKPTTLDGDPVEVEVAFETGTKMPSMSRPIRIKLGMDVMRSKLTNGSFPPDSMETIQRLMREHKQIYGKVVIHFVLDTNGKIKKINVVEGSTELAEPFLQVVKQWTFEPTTLDGEPVEVDVNLETGRQRNGKWE
jgi:TonB family protein